MDRAIATLKRSIFRRVVADGNRNWAKDLPTTVEGYNSSIHSSLQGRTPEEVEDDPELQFALRRANSEAMVHNAAVIAARDKKLTEKGAFRLQDPRRPFQRSYQPRYGNDVHTVARADGGLVVDTEGNAYKSRHALAVPAASAPAAHTEGMRGGNALLEQRQREALEPYRAGIAAFVGAGPKWIHEVAAHMKAAGVQPLIKNGLTYKKALVFLGYHVDARGSVTPNAPPAPPPAPPAPPPAAPQAVRRRINQKRPDLTPAQAAAALQAPVRRRITGKQPGGVRP